MNDDARVFFLVYVLIATGISIPIALALEPKLKAHVPNIRPYKWGYYVGCMLIAGAPLALLGLYMALTEHKDTGKNLGLAAYFAAQVISGVFILRRRRWAWVLGTIVS